MNFVISCDMKLASILGRLQSHASTHLSKWCNINSRTINNCGSLRTISPLLESIQAFKTAGNNVKPAKKFGDVAHEPIVSGSSNTLILELIQTMDLLHLFLCVVNHLFRAMKDDWPKA